MQDQFAALLESNRLLQQAILGQASRKQKVYIPMPEKFDGKVGDFIEAWLEQFETWFRHREQVEGMVEPRTRVATAIQNTKPGIVIDLTRHENDYGKWATWEAFANHMKKRYGSSETGYTQFIRLRVTTQRDDESVNKYYGRFRQMLSRQRKTMKHTDDNHLYHYMFIAGLKRNINAEVLRLPESLKMEDMRFNEILELAKCVEQTVNSQIDLKRLERYHGRDGHDNGRKTKTKTKGNSAKHNDNPYNGKISRDPLTPKEKTFLRVNIERGGGLIVNEGLRNKLGWIKWARRDEVCLKCAGKDLRTYPRYPSLPTASIDDARPFQGLRRNLLPGQG
jgi:hypothetical protein